jgi:hypothetical protein
MLGRIIALRPLNCLNRVHLASWEECLYFFTASAVKRGWIFADWLGRDARSLRPGKIYVRTHEQVFETHFRSFRALLGFLDPAVFKRVNASVVVNLHSVTDLQHAPGAHEIAVGKRTDILRASRRCMYKLRQDLRV